MMCDYWDTQLPENVSFDTVMQSAEDLRNDYDDMKAQRDVLLAACEAASQELGRNAYLWETEAELYKDAPELAETRLRWARLAEKVMKSVEAAIARARE